MKRMVIWAAAVALAGIVFVWLLSPTKNLSSTGPRETAPPPAAELNRSVTRPLPGNESALPAPTGLVPGAARDLAARTSAPVAVDLTIPVDSTQSSAIRQVLSEIKSIYGQAGALGWDQAKTLITSREKAANELVDRLAKLGPGSARAIATAYPDTDTTRAKLLLVHALGRSEDIEASAVLNTLLGIDNSLSLRKEMVLALGQRNDPASQQALAAILSRQEDAQLRFASAQALAGRESALPLLAECISKETSPEVRAELIHSIGLAQSPAAMNVLVAAAQGPLDVALRNTAIQELARSFGGSALDILDKLLRNSDEAIRLSAVKGVTRVQNDAATALLQRAAATDASPTVRSAATAALAKPTTGPVGVKP